MIQGVRKVIYIASALISVFTTVSLVITALWLKYAYDKVLNDTKEFMKMICRESREKEYFK